jgi:predicted DNA-binding transcriptional regulator AlpA
LETKVLTTDEVCSRYQWSATTLWRQQRRADTPFPLPDFDGRPSKWLESTLTSWEEENRLAKRVKQQQMINQAAI